jgi:Zn-finger nucleic acid-binding protein
MKCPDCNNILERFNYKGIGLDVCGKCDGVWLDDGELRETARRLIAEGKIPDAKIEVNGNVVSIWGVSEKTRKCPKCRRQMRKINYAYDSNVIVDKCDFCNGIWTNSGELQKLAIFLKGNPILDRMGTAIASEREKMIKEPIAKVKTSADEGDCEIQTSHKTGGIPKAVCRGFCGEV